MQSSNIKYLPAIDHLRAYAALLIVFYHGLHLFSYQIRFQRPFFFDNWLQTKNILMAFLNEGHTAVSLFMVLSGFIFVYGVYGCKIDGMRFIYNRFLRTYPLFLVFIILGMICYPGNINLTALAKTIFGFANQSGSLYLGPISAMFWTIAVEWQFYIVFPLLLKLLNKNLLLIIGLIFLFLLLRIALYWKGDSARDVAYLTIFGRMDQFLIGMIAAVLVRKTNDRKMPNLKLLATSLLVILLSMFGFHLAGGWPVEARFKILWPTYEALMWAFFIFAYLRNADGIPAKLSGWISRVGMISYSIYLVHFTVIYLFIKLNWFFTVSNNIKFSALFNTILLVLPVVIGVSSLSYRWIEKPFLERRVKYVKSLHDLDRC